MSQLNRQHILDTFGGYGHPRADWLVGAEFERHLLRPDGSPVPYFGEHGVRWLLQQFGELGWNLQFEGDHPISAERNRSWITLEPGSQFELSDSPWTNVFEAGVQARAFVRELAGIIGDRPIVPVALGYTPFAAVGDIPWAPKGRYDQMKSFLIRHGDLAHHMMKGTCATQVSFDFEDEQDCADKMRLSVAMAPLTTAMFANSPILEGKSSGFMSFRGHIWTRTDPARTGMPDAARDFSFERWVDYLIDVPMMFIKPDKAYLDAHGLSFRQWMVDGIDGRFPTMDDWDLHMTQVFPEVRVKRQIEVRGADGVSTELALSFCALFRGLFYCTDALHEALEFTAEFASHGTRAERFESAARHGLHGEVGGRPMLDWAREVTQLGVKALNRCAPVDRHLLEPLEAQLERGESPARTFLRAFEAKPTPQTVFDLAGYTS